MKNKNILFFMGALLLLVTLFGYWLVSRDDYSPVFNNLEASQINAVENYLSAKGVPFEINAETSQIMVSEQDKYKLRIDLIDDGVINEGRVGYEIFDDSDYGMTDFAQKVNFQRALQGELEKTISAIEGVRNVRVHLKLEAKKALFSKNSPVTASVVIYQKTGTFLSINKVQGIKKLVSGAVTNLTKENVFVIDSSGKTIGNSDVNSPIDIGNENNLSKRLEDKLVSQAKNILGAIYKDDQYRVSVSVELDMNSRTTELESIPNFEKGALTKKKKTINEISQNNSSDRKISPVSEELEYLYGRQIEKISYRAGKLLKVSVGVVIQENKQIKDGVKRVLWAALGLSESRGDNIEVLFVDKIKILQDHTPIASNLVQKKPPLKSIEAPQKLTKEMLVGIFLALLLLLIIFVLFRKFKKTAPIKIENISEKEEQIILLNLKEWVKNG